ncbi:hypothetical protein ACLUUI_18180 [Enterobacterales bacterium AW_CKDN230030176-1A_HGKHYDSX7]
MPTPKHGSRWFAYTNMHVCKVTI